MKPRTIAIDGTAASGKSTLGSALAKSLHYLYLDTGLMYRAITWAALKAQVNIDDEAAVSRLAAKSDLQILTSEVKDGRQTTILVDSADATRFIRSVDVNAHVSQVSSYPGVRQVLTRKQRQIAQQGPVVMVGRDIGTVVLPDADLKIFTVASVEVRAQRRYQERCDQGEDLDYDALLASMIRRDKLDREKPISPMVPASDAIIINTDDYTQQEVLKEVEALIYKKRMTTMTQKAFQDYYPDKLSYCYGCGRLNEEGHQIKTYWDGDESVTTFHPEPYHIAIPGYVYGGLLASVIDCHGTGTAAAAAYRAEGREMDTEPPFRFVTASLHVDYLRPTPLGPPLELRGRVKEIKGRKVVVAITLSVEGEVTVRGEIVAVQMPEQFFSDK